jgi:DNA (cytosine-5)-methyltransferase 1
LAVILGTAGKGWYITGETRQGSSVWFEEAMQRRLTVVDLFCGAGGLSVGFRAAGFALVWAADNQEAAVRTYRANLGEHVVCQCVREDTEPPEAAVFAGGPPCQGFSSAGMRRPGDQRNTLVACFAQIVARKRPLAFVFENVEGFLTAEGGKRVLDLLTPLVGAGYRIHLRKVNAANYGVPQHRKRVIAIGGLGWEPSFPEPTHSAHGAPGARLAGICLPPTPTLQEALAGLPPATTKEPGNPAGHFYRPLAGIDLERARVLKPGQTMRDLPKELWHESYRRRAYRRVMDGTPTERRGGAPAGVRRLVPDAPCKAITGGALSEFLHPAEDRNLTFRECARIQTFSDEFTFRGNCAEQAQLIGNAVPPVLATTMARSLAAELLVAERKAGKGELLSFVPTLSNGMSPILERVTRLVASTFRREECVQKELFLWD